MVNGVPQGFFASSRGATRQGDLLSPLLFNLAADVLSRMILRTQNAGLIRAFSTSHGASPLANLHYADDTLLFFEADPNMIKNLQAIRRSFEIVSFAF